MKKKVVAIIPARSGSKGFPHKNLAKIESKTLMELAIDIGRKCPEIDDTYVTTDSAEYEAIAIKAGARSLGLRPKSISGDDAKTVDAVIDVLDKTTQSYDYAVLLQPTAPIRMPEDVNRMLTTLSDQEANGIVSIEKIDEPHPNKMKRITTGGRIVPYIEGASSEIPRHMLPDAYKLNGAIYICRTDALIEKHTLLPDPVCGYVMNKGINIDTEEDFLLLKMLYDRQSIKIFGLP